MPRAAGTFDVKVVPLAADGLLGQVSIDNRMTGR